MQEIWNLLRDNAIDSAISKSGIPGLPVVVSAFRVLMDSNNNAEWNRFRQYAKPNQGNYPGVIVYTYKHVMESSYTRGSWPSTYTEKEIWLAESYSYSTWTGYNFGSVKGLPSPVQSGNWLYEFK